jgi:hypothetical protein
MATVQTPASIAAAASALIDMVGTLNATGDPVKQTQADALNKQISDTLTQASNLAAADVIDVLTGSGALAQLQKFDQNAKAAATRIAADETKVANAISFLTSATTFVGAIATGNVVVAGTQLGNMLSSLDIK